jgi:hypothetical protein
MDVNGPVICGVDDSSVAVGAVEVARALAQRYELPLVYAHVIDGGGDGEEAEQVLRGLGGTRACRACDRAWTPGRPPRGART